MNRLLVVGMIAAASFGACENRTTILDTPANEASPAWQKSATRDQADKQDRGSSFACPELLRPGPRARRRMRAAVDDYLSARQPKGTSRYTHRIERLTRPILDAPEGACSRDTWRRSFVLEGTFEYGEKKKKASASLAYFRVVLGRTKHGWVVWAEPH